MPRPTVRQLESIVAVADTLSFRRAAAALGLSQPALSAHVAAAEDELGVQLFERDRRSVLVTPAGADVIAGARIALGAIDDVAARARARGEPLVGPLRLGVIPTVAPYWLPAILPAVRAAFPRLELVLYEHQTATLLAQLGHGQLDVAMLALPASGDVTAASIGYEPFVLAAPRGSTLIKRGKLAERDLDGQRVLLLEDGHCLRDQALAVCARRGALARVVGTGSIEVQATSLPTLAQMVAGGLGVTLLPALAAAALAPRNGPIQIGEFTGTPPGRTIGLVWRTSSARLPEFRALAETMRKHSPLSKIRR